MPIVEHSIELNAPPQRVWSLLTALDGLPLWLEGAQRIDAISGAAGPGTRFQLRRSGSPYTEQWIIADWEPPQRLRYTEYQRDLQLRFSLTPTASGTRVTASWQTPRSRGVLERPVFQKADRRMLERSLERLRSLLTVTQAL